MIVKSYIDRCNTIISGSSLNTGLNPVGELNYGQNVSRMIIHFSHEKVKKLIDDGTCPDISKFKHILKMTNSGTIDFSQLHCSYESKISDGIKLRASSFDLIFFLLPEEFDGGKGFDGKPTFLNQGYYAKYCPNVFSDTFKLQTNDGSNWFQSRNGYPWTYSGISENYGETSDGVYSIERLSKEYDKFGAEEESIIIGRQHFDIGNENIELDITEIFNEFIKGNLCNYGLGIAYTPMTELINDDGVVNYVGFFTNKTNTFFEPFVESIYDNPIIDNRANFSLDKENRLYLYSTIDGNPTDLDELPTCTINGKQYNVKKQSKGVYYSEVLLLSNEITPPTMLYDEWSNIIYKGVKLSDTELYFTVKEPSVRFNIGNSIERTERYVPSISGIKNNEKIIRTESDNRKIIITANVPYTANKSILCENMEIRLYVNDDNSEITVIDWDKIDMSYLENFYILRICDLIPNEYHVDVRLKYNGEVITHKNLLYFSVVNDKTNKYL